MDTLSNAGDTLRLTKHLQEKSPHVPMKLLNSAHHVTEQEITYLQQVMR